MSVVGKRSPVSTTTIRPPYSTTVMFLPISPSPPSGRTRSFPVLTSSGCRREHAVTLEHVAHGGRLPLVELDVREPRAADSEPQQVQRRLDAAGQRGDRQVAIHV